jgi:hypothetical protein
MLWSIDKLISARNRTPAFQSVAMPTELSRLFSEINWNINYIYAAVFQVGSGFFPWGFPTQINFLDTMYFIQSTQRVGHTVDQLTGCVSRRWMHHHHHQTNYISWCRAYWSVCISYFKSLPPPVYFFHLLYALHKLCFFFLNVLHSLCHLHAVSLNFARSRDGSVDVATPYGVNGRGSISIFSSLRCPD